MVELRQNSSPTRAKVRCAVYTCKSSEACRRNRWRDRRCPLELPGAQRTVSASVPAKASIEPFWLIGRYHGKPW